MSWFTGIQIKEIMTRDVITVEPDDVMSKVRDIFDHYSIHHIPVVHHNELVGIISREDYFRVIHGFCMQHSAVNESYNDALLRSLLVAEVMSKNIAHLEPDDLLETAAGYFRENLFHAIPVVDKQNQLLGIITTYDLINTAFKTEPVPSA